MNINIPLEIALFLALSSSAPRNTAITTQLHHGTEILQDNQKLLTLAQQTNKFRAIPSNFHKANQR